MTCFTAAAAAATAATAAAAAAPADVEEVLLVSAAAVVGAVALLLDQVTAKHELTWHPLCSCPLCKSRLAKSRLAPGQQVQACTRPASPGLHQASKSRLAPGQQVQACTRLAPGPAQGDLGRDLQEAVDKREPVPLPFCLLQGNTLGLPSGKPVFKWRQIVGASVGAALGTLH
jgi:hypothetical protein